MSLAVSSDGKVIDDSWVMNVVSLQAGRQLHDTASEKLTKNHTEKITFRINFAVLLLLVIY